MQVTVYVPQTVEIPSEYLLALVQRAQSSANGSANDASATRGHLVRQAVRDGLLRQFDPLLSEDGSVDLFCDPGGEIPLEIDDRNLTLQELYQAMQAKLPGWEGKSVERIEQFNDKTVPRRKAA